MSDQTSSKSVTIHRFFLLDLKTGKYLPIENHLTLGRTEGARTFPADKKMSRTHLRLSIEGEHVFAEDLETRNGTRLNSRGLPPKTKTRLHVNDVLEFGTQRFRFVTNQPGAPAAKLTTDASVPIGGLAPPGVSVIGKASTNPAATMVTAPVKAQPIDWARVAMHLGMVLLALAMFLVSEVVTGLFGVLLVGFAGDSSFQLALILGGIPMFGAFTIIGRVVQSYQNRPWRHYLLAAGATTMLVTGAYVLHLEEVEKNRGMELLPKRFHALNAPVFNGLLGVVRGFLPLGAQYQLLMHEEQIRVLKTSYLLKSKLAQLCPNVPTARPVECYKKAVVHLAREEPFTPAGQAYLWGRLGLQLHPAKARDVSAQLDVVDLDLLNVEISESWYAPFGAYSNAKAPTPVLDLVQVLGEQTIRRILEKAAIRMKNVAHDMEKKRSASGITQEEWRRYNALVGRYFVLLKRYPSLAPETEVTPVAR